MKDLLFIILLLFITSSFAQRPNEYKLPEQMLPGWCDTAETVEDCTNSWTWHVYFQDCINPPMGMCEELWPYLWTKDTWECCCERASTPTLEGAFNGFIGSNCEAYMISIEELIPNNLKGIYIDVFGRIYTTQPKGLSIMNGKKYYKF